MDSANVQCHKSSNDYDMTTMLNHNPLDEPYKMMN